MNWLYAALVLATSLTFCSQFPASFAQESGSLWSQFTYEREPSEYQNFLKVNAARIGSNIEKISNLADKPLKALVLFDVSSNGNIIKIRPIRVVHGIYSEVTLPEQQFELIEKMLVRALNKSNPLLEAKSGTYLLIFDPSNKANNGVFLDETIAENFPTVLNRCDCDAPWLEPSEALTYIKKGPVDKQLPISFPRKGSYYKWRQALCYYQAARRYFAQGDNSKAHQFLEIAVSLYPYDATFREELKRQETTKW